MANEAGAGERRWGVPVPVRQPLGIWLRESGSGLMVLALCIGAGAGLGAIVFRWLISSFTELLSGHEDYAAVPGAVNTYLPGLGVYFVLLAPVIAGLIYGPLVYRFAPEARGHGVPEVMYAVSERGGHIPAKVSVVKALASALCIGGGGSVGREGPIVQIGSALGSSFGSIARLPEARLRVLVACGAAGGIAATFNAPLAGPFFAMELILRNFAMESFASVVLASVTASVVGRAALGNEAFLQLPAFSVGNPIEYVLFALLGLLIGAVGVGFSKVLYRIEDACDWAWRGPEWLRPAVGGLLLGGLLLVLPQMYGVGYPVLQETIDGRYVIGFLLVLTVGKMIATSLTIGIGGSGGVFAPSLFIGATAGTAFGSIASVLLPWMSISPGMYGLLGMGAAFAGAARAPITGVIILFEITGEYEIILPMMLAVVLATLVSRKLTRDTIYTAKLRRRGIDLDRRGDRGGFASQSVTDVMEPLPGTLPGSADLRSAVRRLALSGHGMLPVVDDDGQYRGCLTAQRAAEVLTGRENAEEGHGAESPVTVGDLAELPALITSKAAVSEAMTALAHSPGTGLPVVDPDTHELVGWLTHQRLVAAAGGGARR